MYDFIVPCGEKYDSIKQNKGDIKEGSKHNSDPTENVLSESLQTADYALMMTDPPRWVCAWMWLKPSVILCY